MLTLALLSLGACAESPSESDPSPRTGTADDARCADAGEAAAAAQDEVDRATAARRNVRLAGENLVAMKALAVRAANDPVDAADRTAFAAEYAFRVEEAARYAVDDPALDPTTLGLPGTALDSVENAVAAGLVVDGALAAVQARLADLDVDVALLLVDADAELAAWPSCPAAVEAPETPPIDTATPLVEARLDNLAEGRALAAAAVATNGEVASVLATIRGLAVRSATELLAPDDRMAVQAEFVALAAELDRIATTASYAGHAYADGSQPDFEVWLDDTAGQNVVITVLDLRATMLGVDTGCIDLTTAASASGALSSVDAARDTVHTGTAMLTAADTALALEEERVGGD